MKIWVDADACPAAIKEIIYKAVKRTNIPATLVSNMPLKTPNSDLINFILVKPGPDEADNEIVRQVYPHDLVITADIPLAANAIEKGAIALNPRGSLYTEDNIKSHLSTRNFLDELRSGGVNTGGPSQLTATNKQQFANNLDKILTGFMNKQ